MRLPRSELWIIGDVLLKVVLGLTLFPAGTIIASRLLGARGHCCFETTSDLAYAIVKKYAYEAYPSWRAAHPGMSCPASLNELDIYMNDNHVLDPWGNDYEMYCGTRGIVVHSRGVDEVRFTSDDLWSH